jgi:MHS family proline/betaine transporter-like MFS transporter
MRDAQPEQEDVNARARPSSLRTTAAIAIGNVFEWYDFVVYGYFATSIAAHFFPADDDRAALLATFAAFGIGFIFRPFGAVVIGAFADRKGRKAALILTLILMASGTLLIGVLPSYQSIGIAAPALLVIARLAQGFSIGGEWGTSVVYLVEAAPPQRRGLYSSFQQVTVVAGLLLGSGLAALLASLLEPGTLQTWGWRLPFLVGGVLAPIGFYLRRSLVDTAAYRQRARGGDAVDKRLPLTRIVQAFGLSLGWSVMAYIFLVYMPTFSEKYVRLDHAAALWANTLGLLVLMIALPFCGLLSDWFGRRPMLLASCIGMIALPVPLVALALAKPSFWLMLATQLIVGLIIALFAGPAPAAVAEIFGAARRTILVSSANGFAVAIFGGFAPFIATWLIGATGSPIAPFYYVIAAVAVSAVVTWGMAETAHRELR